MCRCLCLRRTLRVAALALVGYGVLAGLFFPANLLITVQLEDLLPPDGR
jgi:hypothetical protein